MHVGGSSIGDLPAVLKLIDASKAAGMDISTEVYPYTAASTMLESAMFNPGWQANFKIDYGDLAWSATGERLTAQSFAADFRKQHWPGQRQPEIWHDPRQFEQAQSGGGVLHAKTVIVDRKVAYITSANFTGAAQIRNIEAGVLPRQPRIATRLHAYFTGLIATNVLRRVC